MPWNIHPQIKHKRDYRDIHNQKTGVQKGHSMYQQSDFNGEIKRAGHQGNPFRPGPGSPQAIGFHETQPRITACYCDHDPDFSVAKPARKSQEQMSNVAIRADMKQV